MTGSGPNERIGPTVALYVTGHGYGHAVRCAVVARVLLERGARVLLRTEAPRWLFPSDTELMEGPPEPIDVGVVQRDGLEMDLAATRHRWETFADGFEDRTDQEARALEAAGATVVLGDIPPLAFAAATRAGIPSAAMSNFGWDWIYADWDGFGHVVRQVQAGYRCADLLLRLPLHAEGTDAFASFRRIVDVPLVARRPARSKAEVRIELGLAPSDAVVLLSFGGYDAAALNYSALGAWSRFIFLVTPGEMLAPGLLPENVRVLPRTQTDYVSLVAAADAVVTKPGYGIVADCLANRVPVLYTARGPFREYPVLVAALETWGHARFIAPDELRQGQLGPALDALLALDRPWSDPPLNGAEVVADHLLALNAPLPGPVQPSSIVDPVPTRPSV